MRIDFLIRYTASTVEVRWLADIQPLSSSQLHRRLEELWENIPGVESVHMSRYSALLRVAPHVTTPRTVATQVEAIFDDPDLRGYFKFEFTDPEIEVYNAGPTIKF